MKRIPIAEPYRCFWLHYALSGSTSHGGIPRTIEGEPNLTCIRPELTLRKHAGERRCLSLPDRQIART
jgi:hypothetical protein